MITFDGFTPRPYSDPPETTEQVREALSVARDVPAADPDADLARDLLARFEAAMAPVLKIMDEANAAGLAIHSQAVAIPGTGSHRLFKVVIPAAR